MHDADRQATPPPYAILEVVLSFLKLGLISFGGPVAHLGYFHSEFVGKRRWLDDRAYADIVALCQFLPGPASSQVAFVLGMVRAGFVGALAASLCFLLPSAVLMIVFAYGVAAAGDLKSAGWLHGLKLAAVAVVAQAVWGMGRSLCPDRPRVLLCFVAAAAVLIVPGSVSQITVIAGGAVVGWMLYRGLPSPASHSASSHPRGRAAAAAALVLFLVLLLALPVAAAFTGSKGVAVFDSFYRAGSLVFGGGHVVLPLLREELVPRGWVSDEAFLAGYGAAQAVPGPIFSFAAYLGTVMHDGARSWIGGAACVLAIFFPGWLLVGGAWPFWGVLRSRPAIQAALRGANAAVVGILLAALYSPVITEGVRDSRDAAAAILAFALLEVRKLPPWTIVLLCAAAGRWLL